MHYDAPLFAWYHQQQQQPPSLASSNAAAVVTASAGALTTSSLCLRAVLSASDSEALFFSCHRTPIFLPLLIKRFDIFHSLLAAAPFLTGSRSDFIRL